MLWAPVAGYQRGCVVFQMLSRVRLFVTPWTAALQSFTMSWNLFKPLFMESVMPSNHLILCFPLLLLPSIFPRIKVFSKEPNLPIRWPKYWSFSFSFSLSLSSEYSGLISLGSDWFDLLGVQGTLQSLLWHLGADRIQPQGWGISSQPLRSDLTGDQGWLFPSVQFLGLSSETQRT